MNNFPNRSVQHEIDSKGLALLQYLLPDEYIFRNITERDYGIDAFFRINNVWKSSRFSSIPSDLSNSDWLVFWGGFIGCGIGGIATIIAVNSTLTQNLKFQNENSNEQKEKNRLDILPFINIILKSKELKETYEFPSGYMMAKGNIVQYDTGLPNKYKIETESKKRIWDTTKKSFIDNFPLEITNIGLHAAINVKIYLIYEDKVFEDRYPAFNLPLNTFITVNMIFQNKKSGNYILKFEYNDIYIKHTYTQEFGLNYTYTEAYLESKLTLTSEQKLANKHCNK